MILLGIILLAVGLLVWKLIREQIISVIGLIVAVIGAILIIWGVIVLASSEAGLSLGSLLILPS